MRLKPHEVVAIKAAAMDAFGGNAVVRLFGSRVDDSLRGGDLDLHIELPAAEAERRRGEVAFRRTIWRALDWGDVDVVVAVEGEPQRWIDAAAHRTGIVL